VPDLEHRIVHLGPIRIEPRIIVYATIIQLTAFALLDTRSIEGRISWLNLLLISMGPMLALALAHTFSEVLDYHIRAGEHVSATTVRGVAVSNLQFLYVGLIPLLIAVILLPSDISMTGAVNIIFGIGIISLFGWGLVAARMAGRTLGRQLLFGLAYGIAGCIVVAMELILRH
jgi:hypothetical protein